MSAGGELYESEKTAAASDIFCAVGCDGCAGLWNDPDGGTVCRVWRITENGRQEQR